jgi:hypothetical protein
MCKAVEIENQAARSQDWKAEGDSQAEASEDIWRKESDEIGREQGQTA